MLFDQLIYYANVLVSRWETLHSGDIYTIKESVLRKGPGYLSFKIFYPFYNYWRGYNGTVYKHPTNAGFLRGGHACQVIGWDDAKKAWLLQNSWGMTPPGPMGDGTFWLPYDANNQLFYGFGFVTVTQLEGGGGNAEEGMQACNGHSTSTVIGTGNTMQAPANADGF